MEQGCIVCKGKRYVAAIRDDGRAAIERCDACQSPADMDDMGAAALARMDGIECDALYPCYVTGGSIGGGYVLSKENGRQHLD